MQIGFTEPFLQFFIFHLDHHGAGDDCPCGEGPADGKARGYAPGEHFAEVRQIDGMPDAGADAGCYQALLTVSVHDLGQSAELLHAEVTVRQSVEN